MAHVIFFILLTITLLPIVQPAVGLLLGIIFALVFSNPWEEKTSAWSKYLLQAAVIGLGFNLDIVAIYTIGRQAIWFTIAAIIITMVIGLVLGKWIQTKKKTAILIAAGTAICGGSAIAAMSPAIKAKNYQTTAALSVVFILNGIGLIIFPSLGQLLGLNEAQFGVWAALAIHDTSSVVGATIAYGPTALALALTVKLTRALWILPLTLFVGHFYKGKKQSPFPYFLIGFLIAATLRTLHPEYLFIWNKIAFSAKGLLATALFLVGTGMTRHLVKKVGLRPFLQGAILWILVTVGSLAAILLNWIPNEMLVLQ